MGQLIKLQDYISRYEIDTYRYPGQFIRLKKQQWEKVKNAWDEGELHTLGTAPSEEEEKVEEEKPSIFRPFKRLKKSKENTGFEVKREGLTVQDDTDFSFVYTHELSTLDEVKQSFLDHIFKFQMKWASSTVREKSFVDRGFYYDDDLKYFLQRFPDTYLVLYKPIFLLKKAPIEVDIILISPVATWCITLLEGKKNSVFIGSNERFWTERNGITERKQLSPLIGLNRMERIVRKLYALYEVEMPVHKVVLNRTGYFDYPLVPYDIELVEKRNYEQWFTSMRNLSTPLKHMQLKAANSLLQYCQTTYVRRMD
ncbi:nuclease-related domain-containing protein [Fredinandcohnia quinoae]|uniref:NERD domain-containing protein n=1 Tax=Fredinandcohnia quinoae TaxID=2918902 RepID=A0AAW5E6V5_9BACI|nr:nuclease-related domain-containing protein [Fredinandcohnia sp. SECRCQ15]MCH1625360.1 NERD domain-containing protein [Fredinandcohnia sp. SECRCQ15]